MQHQSTFQELLLKPSEAASRLRISERTLWNLARSGEIPSFRVGRSTRYRPADLEAWIESRRKEPLQKIERPAEVKLLEPGPVEKLKATGGGKVTAARPPVAEK